MSDEDDSMSEVENEEQNPIDFIMSLDNIPTKLPTHLELQKTRVICNNYAPQHTDPINYSGAYAAMGVDNSVRLSNFCQNFKVEVKRFTDDDIEFDMIGIDPAIANAFRRILIAEVPTMAIERVYIANNTSLIHDEVLAHRLGLIPINADPKLFEYPDDTGGVNNEKNTIVFKLHVRCEKGHPRITVKSDALKWLPNGSELIADDPKPNADSNKKTFASFSQPNRSEPIADDTKPNADSKKKTFTSFSKKDKLPVFAKPLAPNNLDIILAKLGPGQEIELEAHAVKGIGKTHAKWSPVSTAWYRMLPEVVLMEDVMDEKAEELVSKCPVQVFDIEDIGKGRRRARVVNARACTLCRECIREEKESEDGANDNKEKESEDGANNNKEKESVEEANNNKEKESVGGANKEKEKGWEDLISLRRVKDHFIFTIESTGALAPDVLFTEAVKILEDKCERVITELS